MRILIVDDNATSLESLRTVLEDLGHQATAVPHPHRAIEEAARTFYPLIITDISMPEMNGLEAAKTIRRMERSDARAVPIIAMTADAFRENIGRCLEAGMDAHLAKPVDVQEMGRVLVKFLAKGR